MGNLLDYLAWRGDLPLAERPFNLVDNLVLSALAYVHLDGLVPGPEIGGDLTIAQAAAMFEAQEPADHDPRRLRVVPDSLLPALAATRRFRNARLSRHVDVVDLEDGIQFSALTIALDDGTTYVAYRGTDMTIVGWREDFVMSFQPMGSQRLAADYLHQVLATTVGNVRVGGHSKGGNLAVHAAAQTTDAELCRIITVHSNDGPGLSPQAASAARVDRILDRQVRIGPEFSIVGMLFNDEPPDWIVASDAPGVMQHDIMTWQVTFDALSTRPALARGAIEINAATAGYLDDADDEERRRVTEAIFGSLSAGGAVLLQDIRSPSFGGVELVLLSLTQSCGQLRRPIRHGLRVTMQALAGVDYAAVFRKSSTIRLTILGVVGLFLIMVPGLGVQILASMAIAGLVFLVAWRMGRLALRFGRRYAIRWSHIVVGGTVSLAILVALTHIQAFVLPANLFVGACFLVGSWTSVRTALPMLSSVPRRTTRAVLHIVNSVVALLFGIVALSTAGMVLPFFVQQAGQYLLIVAVTGLALNIWDEKGNPYLQHVE